jgi:hypothetical protein
MINIESQNPLVKFHKQLNDNRTRLEFFISPLLATKVQVGFTRITWNCIENKAYPTSLRYAFILNTMNNNVNLICYVINFGFFVLRLF